jgi:hypothetical protein
MECSPRPTQTIQLVQRLGGLGTKPRTKNKPGLDIRAEKEKAALLALSRSIVQAFVALDDGSKIIYASEVAAISPWIDDDNYKQLFPAFCNAIAHGSSDSKVPDTQLLSAFNTLLHCPQALRIGGDLDLGYPMLHLVKRLQTASFAAADANQYRLICALSAVLDAMNEVKAGGVSDIEVVQPFVRLLDSLCDNRELRLAQAARYARQALLGIPSDVSPWKKLWDNTYKTGKAVAEVAGAVSTLDPSKLLEGLEKLAEVPELVKSIIDVVEPLSSLTESTWSTWKDARNLRNPAGWYVTLRYTDLLIRGNAKDLLKSLLDCPKLPCRQDKEFLCGLCAQFEQANSRDAQSRDVEVIDVLRTFLIQQGKTSKHDRVQEWVRLVIGTTDLPSSHKPAKHGWLSSMSGSSKYRTTIGHRKIQPETPGDELLGKAWKICREAQVFYADQVIREHYRDTKYERLKIRRINGASLPLSQCYINLAVLPSSEGNATGKNDKDIPPAHSIRRRLQIWEPPDSDRVHLPDLFKKSSSVAGMFP